MVAVPPVSPAPPGTLPMDPPLWPERSMYRVNEHPEMIQVLERWVMGERVHPYGLTAVEQYGWDAAYHNPPHLHIQGSSDGAGMRWSVYGWRRGHFAGDDDTFYCSGLSHPSDACYAALTMIEEEEREAWEAALVLGLA